ncbi:MAG: response regulator [Planctomycetota bacterium]
MLVLTRRPNDRVTFPDLGITLHFLRIRSGQARIGVDAPNEVRIRRGEEEQDEQPLPVSQQILSLPRKVRHSIRNELHHISLGIHLFRELNDKGLHQEAESMFLELQDALGRLDANRWFSAPKVVNARSADPTSPSLIVLVEDDDNERELLAGFLRMRGFQVEGFRDGRSAIRAMEATGVQPVAFLVDMQMPVCDGSETVKQLRATAAFQNNTIFAVSGCSPEEYGVPIGNANGVDQWFPKPLNPGALIGALEDKEVA